MIPKNKHRWDLNPNEAMDLQKEWAPLVIKEDQFPSDFSKIAGVDLHYLKNCDKVVAGVVVLDRITHGILATSVVETSNTFPYIPGLFSFREIPSIVKAMKELTITPDLIICDGQGYAHPRRFGLACHLGVMFDIPTIGCGKTRFVGEYAQPGLERGDTSPLIDQDEVIGSALRTQNGIKPIFVSIGHRVSLNSACQIVLSQASKYRLPETTRKADHFVRHYQ